jgi:hypothetical protein
VFVCHNACSRPPPAHAQAGLLHIPLLLPGPTKPCPACCKLQGSCCLSLRQLQAVSHPRTRESPRARVVTAATAGAWHVTQVWASVVTGGTTASSGCSLRHMSKGCTTGRSCW